MANNRIKVFSSVFFFIGIVFASKLPSSFSKCKRNDPKLNECLQVNVIDAIKKLANGNSELGLPSLEPLRIPEMNFGEGSGPVSIKQDLKNIELHGLTNAKITKYVATLDKYQLYTESVSPELRLEADYVASGRVLVLPIQGKGRCNFTMYNVKTVHTLHGEPLQKKGKDYMKLKEYKIELYPELVKFHFDNLFNGDERLGNELNKVLNENWEQVFGDLKSGYEESFGLVLKGIANRLFTKVPIKDIFID